MGSLRTRLVVGLVLLTATGLAVVGAITYAAERSFLLNRVDQQLRSSINAVSIALDDRGFSVGDANTKGAPDGGGGRGPDGHGGDRTITTDLPPGTYGQRRTNAGAVVGHTAFSYGEKALPTPRLPVRLPLNRIVSVGAVGSSAVQYRVLAERESDRSAITVVAVPLTDVSSTLDRLLGIEGIVIGVVVVALGLLALLVVAVGLRPLDRIARGAGAIAAGDLAHRVEPATPRTEVGRLGIALNTMLDRLQDAFQARERSEDRLRQFLADASHELRTPLASIRGYAEVFRLGAATEPDDLATAMRRIEDEAARMGVLVEDLLALARLDAVREPVREAVELSLVVAEAVDAARVVAKDRPISLHGDPSVSVQGDRLELRRAIDNLMRNALTHTPADAAIEVTVRRGGDGAEVEIRDHGPGLPAGDPAELFERFSRPAVGRSRGKGGAGLGLAIVAATVARHDGTVVAENAPGGGARFIMRLPGDPR